MTERSAVRAELANLAVPTADCRRPAMRIEGVLLFAYLGTGLNVISYYGDG
jgi:hypothetical protein